MAITWKLIVSMALKLLIPMLRVVTPVLVAELKTMIQEFYRKALITDNPWDDLLAEFLMEILDIDKPAVTATSMAVE